ncbi:chemotaxis protein CheW [Geobacter sp. FeAm09]|uniref:chemotaxis protein CheW n=1 Tax=Geobacter sp. FeAm09 TaxID=2597769 RepID=UPI0011ECCCB2|nr:chemotaxis protein CheW [Geobacter sp. FeAm09]QEM68208.1 chemotaxis protein CheW [Geobacter sp. FeAm09]
MKKELQNIELACFSLGDRLFAVDIMRIKEIILPQKLAGLPRESDLLEGVINLRGELIPVMDMRHRFGMPKAGEHVPGRLLIVSLQGQMLALAVDDVQEVITVLAGEIKPAPDIAEGIGMEYVLGMCLSRDQMFMILDIDSLLAPSDVRLESLRG